jgi:hypothetical protein
VRHVRKYETDWRTRDRETKTHKTGDETMKTGKEVLIDTLKSLGADGLWHDVGDFYCGCHFDNFIHCNEDYWMECIPAALHDDQLMLLPLDSFKRKEEVEIERLRNILEEIKSK